MENTTLISQAARDAAWSLCATLATIYGRTLPCQISGELPQDIEAYARAIDAAREECRNFESIRNGDLVAERDKLRGYYDEIVRELGDDLALKRIRDLNVRCEKLEKALRGAFNRASVAIPDAAYVAAQEALNQSPAL